MNRKRSGRKHSKQVTLVTAGGGGRSNADLVSQVVILYNDRASTYHLYNCTQQNKEATEK